MKDAIEQRLATLEPPTHGGQTRAIRERYDAIEAALKRGVTRQQIVELLGEEGIKVSLPFFKNILHRIRQERKLGAKQISSTETVRESSPQESPQLTHKPDQATDAWQRIDEIANSTPDLQALRRQHLDSIKREKK